MADHDSITADELRSILHYDSLTGVFTRIKPIGVRHATGAVAGSAHNAGYINIGVGGKKYLAHRLAWLYVYGEWPKHHIDHINRNRSDNRICNLRDVTTQQNLSNSSNYCTNTSGRKGVYWDKRDLRFRALIVVNYKVIHLGYFRKFEDAVAARSEAESIYQPAPSPQLAL